MGVSQELWNNFHVLTTEQIQVIIWCLSLWGGAIAPIYGHRGTSSSFWFAFWSSFRKKLLSSWLLQGTGLLHSTFFLGTFSSSELFSWSKLFSETECSEDMYSTLKQSLNLFFSSFRMDIDCRSAFCLLSRFCNKEKLFMSETIKRYLQQFQKKTELAEILKKLPRQ